MTRHYESTDQEWEQAGASVCEYCRRRAPELPPPFQYPLYRYYCPLLSEKRL